MAGLGVPREDRRVRREDTIAAARPHHGNFRDIGVAPAAVLLQHTAKRLIRQDPRVVVDPSVALRLADHGDHLIRRELTPRDALRQPGGILYALELYLCDFD